jgi:hypothetical protein
MVDHKPAGGDVREELEAERRRFDYVRVQRDALAAELANRVSAEHEVLMAEALAEIKATVDGESAQPVRVIVYGLLAEIDALPKRSALSSPAAPAVAWIANDPEGGPYLTWSEAAARSYPSPDALYRAAHPAPATVEMREAVEEERQACAEIVRRVRATWINGDATTAIGSAFQRACDQALDGILGRSRAAALYDHPAPSKVQEDILSPQVTLQSPCART